MYIDPGSGSMLTQVILATLLGTLVFARKGIGKVVHFLMPHRSRPKNG